LSTDLRFGLPSGLFHSDFHAKILYAVLVSHIRATYSAHLILLDLIIRIALDEEYKLWGSSFPGQLLIYISNIKFNLNWFSSYGNTCVYSCTYFVIYFYVYWFVVH
jgi:hypothetical protein